MTRHLPEVDIVVCTGEDDEEMCLTGEGDVVMTSISRDDNAAYRVTEVNVLAYMG